MVDQFKTYEELYKELEELRRENEALKLASKIIEYSQAEDELRKSEQKYRLLVDSSNEAIVVIKEGRLRLTNPRTITLTGYSEDEIETIPFQLFIHPDDRAKVVSNHLQRLRGENVPSYYVFRLITKDGSTRWVYMNAVLIDWEGCPATLNFLTDITELKLAEEALQQSSQKWEAIISASPDGIGMITLDGKIQLISDKLVRMHGYQDDQLDDILGRSIFDFIDPEDHKLLIENTRKLLAGEKGDRITEYRAVKSDNSKFYIDVNASILHDPSGNPTSILYVERDISERKLAEAKIKKTNLELEKLNSEKDKLFSIIAHDLRSPFFNLLGLTEMLADESYTMSPEEITKHSKSIHNSVVKLFRLLENLLEWALLQHESIEFTPQIFNLSAIFTQCSELIKQRTLQKGITIINEIPDKQELYADEVMINSVLRNLLSNAINHTNKGGKIVVNARETEERFVEISVTDTGVGIPQKSIGKLFMLGEKVSTAGTENEQGTGLGLILCKEFVERHDGKIWVESKEKIGSTFYFTIPRK